MIEQISREKSPEIFRAGVSAAINGMLECLLGGGIKKCRDCRQVDSCRFLAEAVFAYRYMEHEGSMPSLQ